jgi:aryl-alcohol dehydrogenase (NADP+)
MRYTEIDGLKVSALCLGTNILGWTIDKDESFAVLDAYRDAGGNFLDTADVYARWGEGLSGGESESIIGQWLHTRGARDAFVIATKVGSMGPLTAANIRASLEGSLKRLRIDHIDLYYAHVDDAETPVEETLGAFDALIREGKVGRIGASNHTAPRLAQALDISEREGLARYVALSNHYNLIDRADFEDNLRPICLERSVASVPYYGLAKGVLTGKFSGHGDASTRRPILSGRDYDENPGAQAVVRALLEVAAEIHAAPASIALAWLAAQPSVASPIASSRTPGQLAELVAMSEIELTAEQRSRLDATDHLQRLTPTP